MEVGNRIDAGGSVDIQGVCKSTVVRGEDNFPAGILRVTDCHDTVVYALAPLNYAKIAGCSDCTVCILACHSISPSDTWAIT